MKAGTDRVFYYRAHANAIGGSLKQPLVREVSSLATASLPTAGGFQHAVHERFHLDSLISTTRTSVRVSGTEHVYQVREGGEALREVRSWRTTSTATIEGLNILEVLTADRIVAQVAVDHPEDGSSPRVTLLGSRYENLQMNGRLLIPSLYPQIFGGTSGRDAEPGSRPNGPLSYDEILEHAEYQQMKRQELTATRPVHQRLLSLDPKNDLSKKGSALCSLVQAVSAEAPVESFGHMLHIPDFGNVFLGEMLVNRHSAQLTMLRVEMGCMAEGSISGGSVSTDGQTMP